MKYELQVIGRAITLPNCATNDRRRLRFRTSTLLSLTTYCCLLLGIVAAPVVEARNLLFGLGMLLIEILGKNWRHNAILAVLTLVLVAGPIFCLELSTPGISSGFWWTVSVAVKFGISVAILCTSVHNLASGRHVVKGIIGLIVFFPLFLCPVLTSVRKA